MKAMKPLTILVLIVALATLGSCKKDETEPVETGNTTVSMTFTHQVDGQPVVFDTIIYQNALGQHYSIKTIKYFISRLTFHRAGKPDWVLKDIHYVDRTIPETMTYMFKDKIPEGTYTGISMVYGLVKEDNISYRFTDPPESLMEWPEVMGGGYHYMKLEGQYIDSTGNKNFFNFHAGGLDKEEYEIHIDFINSGFTVNDGNLDLELVMEIQNWFKNPVNWDFDYFGPAIMGNHEAQQTIQKNGHDVFSIIITE